MANVSPSSQKVDDFLSSLSQLSQERLKDNQSRQRHLQKDIDELRRTAGSNTYALRPLGLLPSKSLAHGIRELSFNRSARDQFYEKWKDVGPELPKRPDSRPESSTGLDPSASKSRPMKPTKPDALSESGPKLPKRPELVELVETIEIDLIRPVARVSKPPTPNPKPKPANLEQVTRSIEGPSTPNKQLSFSALEQKIRSGGTKTLEEALEMPPQLPARNKTAILERLPKPAPELPDTKTLPLKMLTKPSIPAKPKKTLRAYEEGNTELLKQLLRQLSPAKPVREEKPTNQFVPEDHIKKLQERRQKPAKPTKLKPVPVAEEKPEAISFLLKLKPTKPGPPKPESKPEALRQFETLKLLDVKQKPDARVSQLASAEKKPALPSDLTSKSVPAAQFHAHLSSLLRVNSEPFAASKPQAPVRSATAPLESSTPLTHPTKSRSKGPKRRLPNSQKRTAGSTVTPAASAASSTPDLSYASSTSSGIVPNEQNQPNKKPPPIKGKKPNLQVKPRRIASGELFI